MTEIRMTFWRMMHRKTEIARITRIRVTEHRMNIRSPPSKMTVSRMTL